MSHIKKYEYKGCRGSIRYILRKLDIKTPYITVIDRLNKGYSFEDAITAGDQPKGRKAKIYEYHGYTGTLKELMKVTKNTLSYSAVYRRLRLGMSIEDAMNPTSMQGKRVTVTSSTVGKRIDKGCTLEEVLSAREIQMVSKNKTYTYKGVTGNITHILKETGVKTPYYTVIDRLNKGYSFEGAVTTVKQRKGRKAKIYEYDGYTGNLKEIIKYTGNKVQYQTVLYRLSRGYSLEDALMSGDNRFRSQ